MHWSMLYVSSANIIILWIKAFKKSKQNITKGQCQISANIVFFILLLKSKKMQHDKLRCWWGKTACCFSHHYSLCGHTGRSVRVSVTCHQKALALECGYVGWCHAQQWAGITHLCHHWHVEGWPAHGPLPHPRQEWSHMSAGGGNGKSEEDLPDMI